MFFSSSLGQALEYMKVMFGVGAHGIVDQESLYLLTTNLVLWLMLAMVQQDMCMSDMSTG